MTLFEQLGQIAARAREQGLIAPALAERIGEIVRHNMNYKHLGLELHGLLTRLAPAVANNSKFAAGQVEELVQWIEARHRRC